MLPVALQLYSVRDAMSADLEGTLRAVSEMGYDGVETAGLFDKTPEEFAALLKKYNLTPVSAHVPVSEFENDLESTCAAYAALGVMNVSLPYVEPVKLPTREGYPAFRALIIKTAAELKKYGITLSYHNHDFEFEKADGRNLLDILYEDLDESILQTQIDTCWANVGGENPSEYVLSYAGRCPTVHLKDFDGVKGENMYALIGIDDDKPAGEFGFRPCGYGKQDIKSIISAAEKAGAKWLIVEQDNPSLDKTPLECAEMSIEYLKEIN